MPPLKKTEFAEKVTSKPQAVEGRPGILISLKNGQFFVQRKKHMFPHHIPLEARSSSSTLVGGGNLGGSTHDG